MNRKLGKLTEEGVMDVSMQEAASSPLRAELWKECGTSEGENGLGWVPGMRTWAQAGREEGVKQGARQEGSCWVCLSVTRTGQGLGDEGRWGPGRGSIREDPGS